jgi:type IV secretory pathway TraG/TraD family ATPase VirD4
MVSQRFSSSSPKANFEERYGREAASEIIDSCDTRLLLGSNDFQTQEYFSRLLGPTTIRVDSISETDGDRGSSQGRNRSFIERKLMTLDEVGRLDDDMLIVFQRRRYPILLKKNFCFKWSHWERISKTHWFKEIQDREDQEIIAFSDEIKHQEERQKVAVATSSEDFDF